MLFQIQSIKAGTPLEEGNVSVLKLNIPLARLLTNSARLRGTAVTRKRMA